MGTKRESMCKDLYTQALIDSFGLPQEFIHRATEKYGSLYIRKYIDCLMQGITDPSLKDIEEQTIPYLIVKKYGKEYCERVMSKLGLTHWTISCENLIRFSETIGKPIESLSIHMGYPKWHLSASRIKEAYVGNLGGNLTGHRAMRYAYIRREQVLTNNENKLVCASCGGACCKNMPGVCHPDDFKDFEAVKDAVLSGWFSIDYWEPTNTDPLIYYVRPSAVSGWGNIVDASWGGACAFLLENGCQLDFAQRPRICQLLEPNANDRKKTGCYCSVSKKEAVDWWLPYQDQFHKFVETVLPDRWA